MTTAPGALVRHTVRIGIYWLCVTVLLWPSVHPLGQWQPLSVLSFLAISSLLIPALGYLASCWRGQSQAAFRRDHKLAPAVLPTLSHTGIIAMELLMVLLAAVGVERLFF